MVTATAARRWRWFNYSFLLVFPPGGVAMLLAAPFASDESVAPLLILGSSWILIGIVQAVVLRNVAHQVILDGSDVLFVGPRIRVRLPVADVVGFGRQPFDWNAIGFVQVRTRTHGTLKTAARMDGATRLTAALREANDQLRAQPAWEDHNPLTYRRRRRSDIR